MAPDQAPAFSMDEMRKIVGGPPATRNTDPQFYEPRQQDHFVFDGTSWVTTPPAPRASLDNGSETPCKIRVLTWNIDMLIPFAVPRMSAALEYLSILVKDSSAPVVIMLQEMLLTDLKQIMDSPWIREGFRVTDVDNRAWLHPSYGITTLIDRRLDVERVFRKPLLSKFHRDALFVDIVTPRQENKVLRMANVHLESLVANPPVRPEQLAELAPYVFAERVQAGIIAGDFNAIQPFDRTLHVENGLKDAYLELGGKEDDEEGFTWGMQVPKAMKGQFGLSRMDKIMYCGDCRVSSLEKIGVGVSVTDEEVQGQMVSSLEGSWVTDHFGLEAIVEV